MTFGQHLAHGILLVALVGVALEFVLGRRDRRRVDRAAADEFLALDAEIRAVWRTWEREVESAERPPTAADRRALRERVLVAVTRAEGLFHDLIERRGFGPVARETLELWLEQARLLDEAVEARRPVEPMGLDPERRGLLPKGAARVHTLILSGERQALWGGWSG